MSLLHQTQNVSLFDYTKTLEGLPVGGGWDPGMKQLQKEETELDIWLSLFCGYTELEALLKCFSWSERRAASRPFTFGTRREVPQYKKFLSLSTVSHEWASHRKLPQAELILEAKATSVDGVLSCVRGHRSFLWILITPSLHQCYNWREAKFNSL